MTQKPHGDSPDIVFFAIVGAVAFLSGAVCLSFGFSYDDFWTIVDNPYLCDPGALWGLLDGSANANGAPDAGRPLMVAQHCLEWRFFGSRSSGYHVVSLFWHVLSSCLVYLVAMRLWKKQVLGVFAGVLFAVLPVHAEVIAVPSFREDSMACALSLLGWYLFLESRNRGGRWSLRVLGWISFMLALGSKEAAAAMLVAVPLCNAAAGKKGLKDEWKEGWRDYVGMAVVFGVAILLRVVILGSINPYKGPMYPHEGDMWGASFDERFLVAGHVFMQGMGQMLAFGWGQAPEYCDTFTTIGLLWGGLGLMFGIAWLGVCFWAWIKGSFSGVAAGGLFLAVTFAPTSNIFWMPNIRADRFWYLPSVGLCFALGWVFAWIWKVFGKKTWGFMVALVAGLFFVAQIFGLVTGLRVYKNDSTLWLLAAKKAPCHHRALVGAAEVHIRREELRKAENRLKQALALRPTYPPVHQLFGRLYLKKKRFHAAQRSFMKALDLGYWKKGASLLGLGRSLLAQGKIKRARAAFVKALSQVSKNSVNASILWELGALSARGGERSKELEFFAASLGVAIWGDSTGGDI